MLKTKYIFSTFDMLVTVESILIIAKLSFTYASGTHIQKISSRSKFCHQHPKIVANLKSQTAWYHRYNGHLESRLHNEDLSDSPKNQVP